jgi:hypothetical protein
VCSGPDVRINEEVLRDLLGMAYNFVTAEEEKAIGNDAYA